ncbi:MAG: M56 family metallopeptidase [Vicinamibacterales bacterium]
MPMPIDLDLVLRATVILAAAWGLVALLRRRSAALRAAIWTSALAGVLALPVASRVVPAWHLAVGPRIAGLLARTASEASPAPPPDHAGAATATSPRATARARAALPALDVHPDAGRALDRRANTDRVPADRANVASPATVLWLGSLLITIALFGRLAGAHVAAWRLLRRTTRDSHEAGPEIDAEVDRWRALVDAERPALAIRRDVGVRLTPAVDVPAVVGLRRPVLLLPLEAADWPDDLRRAVALHELAHVARRDALAQAVSQVACAVYWFVPFTWMAARDAAALRERASDDVVIRAGVRPSAYADALVGLARLAGTGATPGLTRATLAMARPWRLRERVVAILDPSMRRTAPGRAATAGVLAVAVTAVALVAAATPSAQTVATTGAGVARVPPASGVTTTASAVAVAPGATAVATASTSTSTPTSSSSSSWSWSSDDDAQAAAPGLCRSVRSSQNSMHSDDQRQEWTFRVEGDDCRIDLQSEGKVEFNDTFTDVRAITPSGYFRLDTRIDGVRRELDIESRDGRLTRTWRVDGTERPYDAAAQAWFGTFLVELDRRTAVGVDVRLPQLLRQGGVDAVLAETALMTSDYARSRYYAKLSEARQLSTGEIARLMRQAAALTKSDYYAAQVIKAWAGRAFDDRAVREGVLELIDGMSSDYYRATSVKSLVDGRRLGADEMTVLTRVLGRITSDYYKVQTLEAMLGAGSIDDASRAGVMRLAAGIESDYYAAAFLEAMLGAGPLTDASRRDFLDAAGRIGSDHYAVQAFTAYLDSQRASERDLLDVVAAARKIESDHYASVLLRRVADQPGVTERVRSEILAAADDLSRAYATQVRRAVSRD